jgi:cytochrome c oxidase cbb3-type subunit III
MILEGLSQTAKELQLHIQSVFPRASLVIVLLLSYSDHVPIAATQQAPSPDLIRQGAQQFQQSCGFCHGADATGARGPDLLRSKLVADDENGNLLGDIILQGRPDKGMPALSLTTGQIQAIAGFLHDRAREALESARLPKEYPVSKLLTGNTERGKAYFEGSGGCKTCHSTSGDLKGVASKYSPLELEAQMLYPEHVRPAPVTVVLASGEKVKGTLQHLDEFTVALRDSVGWPRVFSRNEVTIEMDDPLAAHKALLRKITQKELHDLFAYVETLN